MRKNMIIGLSTIAAVFVGFATTSSFAEPPRGHAAQNIAAANARGMPSPARVASGLPVVTGAGAPTGNVQVPGGNVGGGGNQTGPVVTGPGGGGQQVGITVDTCMNNVLACLNGGAIPGGLHALFDEAVRNAITGGMMICQTQVDRCIAETRFQGERVFFLTNDVWATFNARVVQPAYFSFVMQRSGGLTPYQERNTCLLIDRNIGGRSFVQIDDASYGVPGAGRHMGGGGGQLGAALQDIDRGRFARWDAISATCYVYVSAINVNQNNAVIEERSLFGGTMGDYGRSAIVPIAAGESFRCNQNMFEMALRQRTRVLATYAVLGVAAGATTGAIIGRVRQSGGGSSPATPATPTTPEVPVVPNGEDQSPAEESVAPTAQAE